MPISASSNCDWTLDLALGLTVSLEDQIKRLRKQLSRERAIRTEAERLGEDATERLYQTAEALEAKTVALLLALDRAETANRARSAFLARISHELRTPLNSILPALQILDERIGDQDPQVSDLIHMAEKASQDLVENIEALLEVAVIGSLQQTDHQRFSIAALIQHATHQFAESAKDAGIEFRINMTQDIPDLLWGDPARIDRVLGALLQNVTQYAPGAPVDVSTTGSRGTRGEYMVTFAVDDGGPGLSAEAIGSVAEAFVQDGEILSGQARGFGLGLTRAHLLTQSMDGELNLESNSGGGLRAAFTVPLTSERSRLKETASEPS